jgi:hypothetical protein
VKKACKKAAMCQIESFIREILSMNPRQEKKLAKWFEEYVHHFAGKGGRLPPMLKLKLVHSRRVAANAAGLARDLGFAQGDTLAAGMLGLLHDIGRFTQFAAHGTFRDELSFNHGQRGADIMAQCPALAACSGNDRSRIIAGIRYHNSANLPKGLKSDALDFVKLARDADKLDIFSLLYSAWKNGDLWRDPDIMPMIKLDGPLNPGALEEIKRRRAISVANIKSLADFFLLQLSWVYDLNFRPSYRRLISRRVIEKIAEALPPTVEVNEQIAIAREHAKKQTATSAN